MDSNGLPECLRQLLVRPGRAGRPPEGTEDSASGRAENPACGDVYALHLWRTAGELHASFEARGCAALMALGAWLAERLDGAEPSEARALDLPREVERMGGLPRSRRHAIAVCQRALRLALEGLDAGCPKGDAGP